MSSHEFVPRAVIDPKDLEKDRKNLLCNKVTRMLAMGTSREEIFKTIKLLKGDSPHNLLWSVDVEQGRSE